MKTTIKKSVILLLFLLLTSCFAMKAPSVYHGMTEREFRKKAKYEELIRMEQDVTVYRVRFGYHADNIRFYYFYKNRLVKMSEGQRAVDYRIRID